MERDARFSSQAVMAFLSSLSIALKTADQAQSLPERRDLFLLVEAEIELFFEATLEDGDFEPEQLREIEQICQIFRGMYHDADLVMLDPKDAPEQ